MARKKKKRAKDDRKSSKWVAGANREAFKAAVAGTVADIEKTTVTLAAEIERRLNGLADQVNQVAHTTADATLSIADKIVQEPSVLLQKLKDEVAQAGQSSLDTIEEHLESLRRRVAESARQAAVPDGSKKKKKRAKSLKGREKPKSVKAIDE